MPNRDGTGPLGQGPMTGRGLGNCGKGLGFRRGLGRGLGRGRFTSGSEISLTKDQEKKILESEIKELEAEKIELEKQLKNLKK